MIEHVRGDHTWASQIDDADVIVLGNICEAVHQSLPVVPWEDFIARVSKQGNDHFVIDWIADTKEKLWIRFAHDPGDGVFWGITSTDQYSVLSVGFMPVQVIAVKEDKEKQTIRILGLMDDLILQRRK